MYIGSSLAVPTFSAALSALTLQQTDPLIATLHYYRDLFGFAFEKPMVSGFTSPEGEPYSTPPEVREAVKNLLLSHGELLSQRVLTGMMFTFPGDCFPDASGIMMTMFQLLPQETGAWLQSTLQMLPAGSMKAGEAERLLKSIADKVQSGETRKIRVLLQGEFSSHFLIFPTILFSTHLIYFRLHQLISPPECRTPRWTGSSRGDSVPIQRMKEEKRKKKNKKPHCIFFLSPPSPSVFLGFLSRPETKTKNRIPPPLPTEHLHIRCYSPFSLL